MTVLRGMLRLSRGNRRVRDSSTTFLATIALGWWLDHRTFRPWAKKVHEIKKEKKIKEKKKSIYSPLPTLSLTVEAIQQYLEAATLQSSLYLFMEKLLEGDRRKHLKKREKGKKRKEKEGKKLYKKVNRKTKYSNTSIIRLWIKGQLVISTKEISYCYGRS